MGLAVLALCCHFYLNEEMKLREWIGVVLAFYYTVKLSSNFDYGDTWHRDEAEVQGWEMSFSAVYILLMAASFSNLGNFLQTRQRLNAPKGSIGAASASSMAPAGSSAVGDMMEFSAGYLPSSKTSQDLVIGAVIGAIFGLSASMSKVGFLLEYDYDSKLCIILGIACSIVITACGVVLRNEAMKRGATMVICATAAMTQMVTVLLVGIFMLDEALPDPDWDDDATRKYNNIVISWVGMLVAAALLASVDRTSGRLDEDEKVG